MVRRAPGRRSPARARPHDEGRRERRVEGIAARGQRAAHEHLAVGRLARYGEGELGRRRGGSPARRRSRCGRSCRSAVRARPQRHRAGTRARARERRHALGCDRTRCREARRAAQCAQEHGNRRRGDCRSREPAVVGDELAGERVQRSVVGGQQRRRAQQVGLGGRMERAKGRQQIEADAVAREAAIAVRGVVAPRDAGGPQGRAHVIAAQLEQRADAPVAICGGQRRERRTARRRGEAIEDRLDPVVARMPGGDRSAGAGARERHCA